MLAAGVSTTLAANAFPPYPFHHSGTAIICAYAHTLHADLDAARKLRPAAEIITINQAIPEIEAFACFSLHTVKLGGWVEKARQRFGHDFLAHGRCAAEEVQIKRAEAPYVDYWWPGAGGVGTSAWGARRLAAFLGFEEVILAGMLLERAPYANQRMAADFRHPKVLKIYRDFITGDVAFHPGTHAMSGWPRRFFGAPTDAKEAGNTQNVAGATQEGQNGT